MKAYVLNSFAKTYEGGNSAGVVLDADALSENEMKRIAAAIGYSETAFIMKSSKADFKVRFFTPMDEVELCGHATVAAFYTLVSKGRIGTGIYRQETKAGVLRVEVKNDLSIMMEQKTPSFYEPLDKKEIALSLNITADDICDLPVQIVSTGLRDIIVPVKSLAILNSIKPYFNIVSEISARYNTVGYHAFTFETLYNSTAHCRNFAPLYGIDEESATGTSNGALACYLFKYGKISPENMKSIIIEQGYSMKKPSEIFVALTAENQIIREVMVGGNALNLTDIEIEL